VGANYLQTKPLIRIDGPYLKCPSIIRLSLGRGDSDPDLLWVSTRALPGLNNDLVLFPEVEALISTGDSNVVIIGVVPSLLEETRETSPQFGGNSIPRVAARIETEVGAVKLDLTRTPSDIEELKLRGIGIASI